MDEKAVIDRTNYLLNYARKKFGYIPPVEINFFDKGFKMGLASRIDEKYSVVYSREGMNRYTREANLTIAHEVAHIVCISVYNNCTHNKQWKRVCLALGGDGKAVCSNPSIKLTPERIHKYYQYMLDGGTILWMGKNRHNKIQKGIGYISLKTKEQITSDHYTGKIGNNLTVDRR